ncbi:hypothetical protein BGZ65_011737, partial [Modicella reniformis]
MTRHVNDEQPSKPKRKRRMIVDEDEDEQKVDGPKHESILTRMMAGPFPAKPEPLTIPAPREYGIEDPRMTKRDWDEFDDLCYANASPTVRLFEYFVEARKRDWSRIKEAGRVRRLEVQAEAQARQLEAWRER